MIFGVVDLHAMIQNVNQIKNGTNIDVRLNVKSQKTDICPYAIAYGVLEYVLANAIKVGRLIDIWIIAPV